MEDIKMDGFRRFNLFFIIAQVHTLIKNKNYNELPAPVRLGLKLSLYLLIHFLQVVGLMMVVLTGIYTGHNGFAWRDNAGLQFNWHPLLMTIGMIYLYGNGEFEFSKSKLHGIQSFSL